jgi:LPXTG-motif cell wall-anchored protein
MKNRLWKVIALLGCLMAGGNGRGDVLIQNQISTSTLLPANKSARFTVDFTLNNSVSLAAIALFSSAATSDTNLDFKLTGTGGAGTVTYSDLNVAANGAANTLGGGFAYMTYFNFGTNISSVTLDTARTWTLEVGRNGGNGINGQYYYSTTNSGTGWTINGSFIQSATENTASYSGSSSPNPAYLSFSLLNTQVAVPEPGTFLLGGVAAASGGAGVWLKRRKKKATEQSEAPEETPAV